MDGRLIYISSLPPSVLVWRPFQPTTHLPHKAHSLGFPIVGRLHQNQGRNIEDSHDCATVCKRRRIRLQHMVQQSGNVYKPCDI
jgi:hypothetical protein